MSRKQNPGKRGNLSQFGLLDIPDLDDDEPLDLSDDDMDLEAELAAISGGAKSHRPKKPAPVPAANLDAMIAESLKDIPSDDDVSDEDDPDLLNELQGLAEGDDEAPPPPSRPAPPPPGVSAESSTVSLLQGRISNYTLAEKNAKASGESGRARRFNRGLKTLNDLLKQARAGKHINDEDIPPPVSIGSKPAETPAMPPRRSSVEGPTVPPRSSSIEGPIVPPRTTSIEAPTVPARGSVESPSGAEMIDSGHEDSVQPQPMELPPPPPTELTEERQRGLQVILRRQTEFKAAALACKHSGDKAMALEYLKVVKQFDIVVEAYKSGTEMDLNDLPTPEMIAASYRNQKTEESNQQSAEPAPAAPSGDESGLITASTVDEALRQRLTYFQQQEVKSKEEGNSSKARRMGRIVKQFQEAIRLNAAGQPIAGDELPTPPGYAPLPTGGSSAPAPAPAPSPVPRPAPAKPAATSRYDKQIAFLLQRQKQFKEAAIRAKQGGDIEKAKEYLRAAKGFDAVIDAARGGLAVDLKSLPLLPKAKSDLEHTFDVVSAEDCDPTPSAGPILASDDDVIARLHQQLSTQLKLCITNRDHNQAMGQIADANRFDHLAISVKQDLDLVAVAKSLGQTPKFHYESRKFSIIQCNTDLNENDLELTIARGIAYNVPNPKEVDTYVKFEFPYPQEAPVSDRTVTVKDTNSPQYNAVFPLAIHRGARPCLRVFKRHAMKLEVYAKGGWFRGDSLLGAAAVKLAPLETAVTIHEAFPLMDGRRPAGGSLEVKLRVRTPLLTPQVENTTHRWLVIDN